MIGEDVWQKKKKNSWLLVIVQSCLACLKSSNFDNVSLFDCKWGRYCFILNKIINIYGFSQLGPNVVTFLLNVGVRHAHKHFL